MRIAMLMGVYHEHSRIGACIRRHKRYVDGVFITHDGPCSDGTIEIAERLGAMCTATQERKYYGDPSYEISRLAALEAGYDWGMMVAPDEQFSYALLESLRKFISDADFDKGYHRVALQVSIRTRYLPLGTEKFDDRVDCQTRVFELDKAYFSGIIHTGMSLNGRVMQIDPEYYIDHWPNAVDNTGKKERYLEVAKLQLAQHGRTDKEIAHLRSVIKHTKDAASG